MNLRRPTLLALAALLTVGSASPVIAQTSCRWEGSQLRCERSRDYDDDDRDRNYRRDRDYDDYRYNRGPYNRGRAYDRWRRDRDYDDDDYRYGRRNRSYYSRLSNSINSIYRSVLGRSADRRGLRTYIERIEDRNWNLRRVRRDLARSREASVAIDRAYREILGRPADRSGLRTYRGRLQDGWSLSRIRQDLANSREARRRYR